MQCNAMQCNAMQCNAMQCNAMQSYAILFNEVHCMLGSENYYNIKESTLNGISFDTFIVLKIPLNQRCDHVDVCQDKNAGCDAQNLRCTCNTGYHNYRGACGKCTH